MSDDRYSTYEAKARFSELLKKVRNGRTVTITYHGQPVAEVRPIEAESGIEARLRMLQAKGIVTRGGSIKGKLKPIGNWPGVLEWLRKERDED